MALFALLLVGVVAVNVAVMRAHVSVNDLDAKIAQLQQENANLAARYAGATAAPRIEVKARAAGEVPASSSVTSVIDLGRKK